MAGAVMRYESKSLHLYGWHIGESNHLDSQILAIGIFILDGDFVNWKVFGHAYIAFFLSLFKN